MPIVSLVAMNLAPKTPALPEALPPEPEPAVARKAAQSPPPLKKRTGGETM
jgi:hypothetical protein